MKKQIKIENILLGLMAATFICVEAFAAHYNWKTEKVANMLPNPLPVAGGFRANPSTEDYETAGWVVSPIAYMVVPEGYVKVEGTSEIVYDAESGTATETWALETLEEQATRQLTEKAMSLDEQLVEKYTAFYAAYTEAIQAAIAAGAEISESISYGNLVVMLQQLNNDPEKKDLANWLEIGFILNNLWMDVVVASEETPAGAYRLLAAMELRRQIGDQQ